MPPNSPEQLRLIRQNELKRVEEREAELKAERKLVGQLIDAGYRSLATKLHPDKGGSRDAMAHLNRARDQLKRQLGIKNPGRKPRARAAGAGKRKG